MAPSWVKLQPGLPVGPLPQLQASVCKHGRPNGRNHACIKKWPAAARLAPLPPLPRAASGHQQQAAHHSARSIAEEYYLQSTQRSILPSTIVSFSPPATTMFRSTLLVAVTALTAVSAQNLTGGLNYSTSGPLAIDVTQISPALRNTWCRAQTTSCPQICGGQAQPNTCDQDTLTYECKCTDGSTPNITDYDQTIPSFICEQWITNCVDNHPNDLDGITGCRSVTCGKKNASSGESTTSSSSAAGASQTATSNSSGGAGGASETSASASGSSASATASSAAMALNIAQQYGTGIMGAGLLAVFGLAL